jgi:3'-phosphoadenosine 5'-phosphosulfate sulfotransferase (PAPS reductase)/FAD synthetase
MQLELHVHQDSSAATPELTVLSYGGGQDSTALLYLYAFNHPGFRPRYAPKRFLVLMADTGDEHPETYAHVEHTAAFCRERGVEFHHIALGMGYHPRLWAR